MDFYGIFETYDNGLHYEDHCYEDNINWGYYETLEDAQKALASLTDDEVLDDTYIDDAREILHERTAATDTMQRKWDTGEKYGAYIHIVIRKLHMATKGEQ